MNAKSIVVLLALHLTVLVAANKEGRNTLSDLEAKLTRTMDEINKKGSIEIYGGMITLDRVAVEEDPEIAGRSSSDPLVCSIETFLRTRKLQIHLPNDGSSADFLGRALGQKDIGVELRSLADGASEPRTKLKKLILPILFALTLKKIILLPIIVTLIGLIGLKGLGAGLMSLLVSGAIALKALLTPPPPSYPTRISYGIVKPQESHYEHWHRSQEEINQPYRGWTPEYNGEQYPYQDIP